MAIADDNLTLKLKSLNKERLLYKGNTNVPYGFSNVDLFPASNLGLISLILFVVTWSSTTPILPLSFWSCIT